MPPGNNLTVFFMDKEVAAHFANNPKFQNVKFDTEYPNHHHHLHFSVSKA